MAREHAQMKRMSKKVKRLVFAIEKQRNNNRIIIITLDCKDPNQLEGAREVAGATTIPKIN